MQKDHPKAQELDHGFNPLHQEWSKSFKSTDQMNTIMTIAHSANEIAGQGQASAEETANEANVRLMYEVDNTNYGLPDEQPGKLEVVHPDHTGIVHLYAEDIVSAQQKVADAVRAYEDRIYKRPPLDIA